MSPRDLLKALARVGFQGREGGNHTILVLVIDGRKTRIRTIVDRHGRDYEDGRIAAIADQLGLKKEEFNQLLGGDMSSEEYRAIVTARRRV